MLVENAGNALVFAEIDGQNGVVYVKAPVALWGLTAVVTFTQPHPTPCMDSFGGFDQPHEATNGKTVMNPIPGAL